MENKYKYTFLMIRLKIEIKKRVILLSKYETTV